MSIKCTTTKRRTLDFKEVDFRKTCPIADDLSVEEKRDLEGDVRPALQGSNREFKGAGLALSGASWDV